MHSGTEEQLIRRSDDLASLSRDAEGGWLDAVVADGIGLVSRRLLMVSHYLYEFESTTRKMSFSTPSPALSDFRVCLASATGTTVVLCLL